MRIDHSDEDPLATIVSHLERSDEDPETITGFLQTADIQFDDAFVKDNLQEILLLLLYESGGANGSQLTEQVASLFGTVVSSGTLYPELYEMEDNGLLAKQEHIRTKEYRVVDKDRAQEILQNWLKQHLVLGTIYTVIE